MYFNSKLIILKLTIVISITSLYGQYKERDWEERYKWQNVEGIFQALEVDEGDTIADIGCHEGFLTVPLAQKVGGQGHIYAVDIDQPKLNRLHQHLGSRGLKNVTTILGEKDDPKLPANSLNGVVILDTYHEIYSHQKVLEHILNALKPGGTLVIVDEMDHKRSGLSRSGQMSAHRLDMDFAIKDLKDAGFVIERKIKTFVWWENNHSKSRLWLLAGTKP